MENQKNQINVGLSIQERMKLLNQKPAEEPKEKPIITTGISVKERLAAMQASKATPSVPFKPSSIPTVPIAERKAAWQEAKNESESKLIQSKTVEIKPEVTSSFMQEPPKMKPDQASKPLDSLSNEEKPKLLPSLSNEEAPKFLDSVSNQETPKLVASMSNPEPKLVSSISNEISSEDNPQEGRKSLSVKDRIKNLGNIPMPGMALMPGRVQESVDVAPVQDTKEESKYEDEDYSENTDGRITLSEMKKPIRTRNIKRINADFDF